jgi:PAS domain S-box-containing protein
MAACNILIVEDDDAAVDLLEAYLGVMGHQVAAKVSTGEEAVAKVGQIMPDLVLMDIVLGGDMDGIEAAGYIQSRFRIPVIYLTAYSDSSFLKRAKITEPFGYLLKPISQGDLRGAIEIAMYKSSMERRLRESEERLELAVEGGNLGVWDWNLKTGKTLWDKRTLETFGYSVGEIKPRFKTWQNMVHAEDWPYVSEELNKHFEGGSPYLEVKYRISSKSGEWKWMLIHGKVVERDVDGGAVRITGTCRDFTDQAQAEEALRASEQRFRDLASLLPEPVFELDVAGVVTFANKAASELLGYSQEDFEKGLISSEIIAPVDRERALEKMQQILSGKGSDGVELMVLRKDGITFPVWFHAIPIIFHNKVVGIRGIGIDLTEIRQIEQALRESEDRYRHLSEVTFEGIVFHDEGKILDANPQFFNMFGYEPHEVLGIPEVPIVVAPESRPFVRQQIEAEVQGPYEATGLRKDGTKFPIEVQARSAEFQGRTVRVAALRDITERKKAEEDLQAAYLKLDKYSTMLEERVYERTVELEESQKQIKEYADRLEKYSEGLAIMLRSVENEKSNMENKVTENCNSVLKPLLDQMRVCDLPEKANLLVDSMEFQIEKIASLTGPKLIEHAEFLTPREIQVCLYIKSGLSSKEIATIMGISLKAISFHRANIRKKLGLVGSGNDLASYLMYAG